MLTLKQRLIERIVHMVNSDNPKVRASETRRRIKTFINDETGILSGFDIVDFYTFDVGILENGRPIPKQLETYNENGYSVVVTDHVQRLYRILLDTFIEQLSSVYKKEVMAHSYELVNAFKRFVHEGIMSSDSDRVDLLDYMHGIFIQEYLTFKT